MRQINIIPTKKNVPILQLIIVLVIAIVTATGLAAITQRQSVSAASVSGFDPGNIISDAVMSNKATMTQGQIQTFLTSKNTCRTNPKNPSVLSRINAAKSLGELDSTLNGKPFTYKYYLSNGKFICMADQKFGNETAAQIIYRASQDYTINPQVLLVLLEKENGLLSDNWPNYNLQYNTATGYGCPDSGPNNSANCNANYFGFKNQIRNAASMFSTLLKGQGWNNYPIGNNYIQYNPNASCGGKTVNVKNRATGALYTYTPYQPNKAALDAGWGAAPPCGAYGNRNFHLLFTSWFGSTNSSQDQGLAAIQNRYTKLGQSAQSTLGSTKGSLVCTNSAKSCYQMYENGAIIWSSQTGAWESYGSIRTRWSQLKYQDGMMGYPTGAVVSMSDGGYYQKYQNGYIIGKPTTGYWESKGSIRTRWSQLKYQDGMMGYPTGGEINMGNKSYYQKFENGYIIGKSGLGFWESYGSIRTRWSQLKYQDGAMGYPTGAVVATKDGGYYQGYQNGYIIGKSGTGYWESKGSIRKHWAKLKYQDGAMGYPTGGEVYNSATNTYYQQYQHNKIFHRYPTSWVAP